MGSSVMARTSYKGTMSSQCMEPLLNLAHTLNTHLPLLALPFTVCQLAPSASTSQGQSPLLFTCIFMELQRARSLTTFLFARIVQVLSKIVRWSIEPYEALFLVTLCEFYISSKHKHFRQTPLTNTHTLTHSLPVARCLWHGVPHACTRACTHMHKSSSFALLHCEHHSSILLVPPPIPTPRSFPF